MSRSLLLSSSFLLLFACTGDDENPSSEETSPTTEFDYTLPGVDTGWPGDTGDTAQTSDTEDTEPTDTEDTEPTDTDATDTEDTDTTDTEDTGVEGSNLLADFEAGAETFTGFGGAEGSAVTDPTDSSNTVGELIKSDAAETWGGVTISYCDNFGITELPFSSTATSISAEVWSDAAMTIRLKVENAADATVSVETDVTTTGKGWETLTWDFSSEASGTAALDTSKTYDKMSIFPNFGTTGADAGEITIYVDDFAFSDVDDLDNECPGSGDTGDTGETSDTGDTAAPTAFSHARDIQPLWDTYCTGCHSGSSPSGSLDLSDGYTAMVGVPSGQASLDIVEPSDATNSYLVHKLNGTAAAAGGSGTAMPPSGSGLSTTELATVTAWISAGADK